MRQLKITTSITSRDSDALEKYLTEISRIPLLSVTEEVELARKSRLGDRRALDTLVCSNLRFVVSVAKQYQNQGLSLTDLINEGNIGLIKAAEKYDETRGFKFISYAVWWVRQTIMQSLAEQSRMVRVPQNQAELYNKLYKAQQTFQQKYERMPSQEELSEMLDIPLEKVSESLKMLNRYTSIDAPLTEGEDGTLIDIMPNDNSPIADHQLMNSSLEIEITRAMLSVLSEREMEVLQCSFGLGNNREMTLDEIGNSLKLSRERVRQIRDKALQKLRNNNQTKQLLKSYL